jgi:hypothetical protein
MTSKGESFTTVIPCNRVKIDARKDRSDLILRLSHTTSPFIEHRPVPVEQQWEHCCVLLPLALWLGPT